MSSLLLPISTPFTKKHQVAFRQQEAPISLHISLQSFSWLCAGDCQMHGRRAIGTGEKRKLNARFFPIHSFRFRLEAVAAVCDLLPWGRQEAPAASSMPSVPILFQNTEPPAHLSCCSAVTHRARRCKFASKIATCKKLTFCSIKTHFIFRL